MSRFMAAATLRIRLLPLQLGANLSVQIKRQI
jgi:hypothetical protein